MGDLNQTEKVFAISCAAAAVLCFFPWFSASISGEMAPGFEAMMGQTLKLLSANAFDSVEGWLAFLGLVIGGGALYVVKSSTMSLDPKLSSLLPLAGCGVSVVCMLIFMSRAKGGGAMGMSVGKTFWFWLALGAAGVAALHALKRFQAGTETPAADDPTPS